MAGRSTGAGARRGGNPRSGNRKSSSRSAAPAAAPAGPGPKNQGWMGARPRLGRWASELRLKCKRQRLWIGTFATPQQAALAYDAAIYCLYGTEIPKTRRFNFPYMPFPNVSEQARAAGIPVANIRAIAERHARSFAVYVEPPPPPVLPVAAAAPPLMVDAAAAAVGGPGAGEVAPVAAPAGNMDDVMAIEEFFNSFSLRRLTP